MNNRKQPSKIIAGPIRGTIKRSTKPSSDKTEPEQSSRIITGGSIRGAITQLKDLKKTEQSSPGEIIGGSEDIKKRLEKFKETTSEQSDEKTDKKIIGPGDPGFKRQ